MAHGQQRASMSEYLVQADMNKAGVEVGCRLMCIGNGWKNLQAMKLFVPELVHRQPNAPSL